ncbi:bifunctional oligoribonuclease/PAP phosphatase NrnA [Promethearchaeum syntrophicum]|uniref:Bifunctional oligoribonuclease/PAP phosphatase NrnA n=1 Tax=Promethearchaeum syntrophicum TaxID=2594042 RepID=A0A5B9D688_9ARCH|nr:DHH family phosphoesterase [Candidatus Prometheoarchaeum syntrophicum]QEE14461.1 putative manganese-dependent inorganic pyrophosphatase [Candidatus Prometheoarchaeum syntrophicum]
MNEINPNLTIRKFISDLIRSVKNSSSIVITGHNNADPDALASVIGLKEFLTQINPGTKIEIVLNLNKIADKVYKEILSDPKWKFSKKFPENIDLLIIVDTSDLGMVINKEKTTPKIQNIIIIDHHVDPIKLDDRVKRSLILSDCSSTAEIIIKFYQIQELIPNRDIVLALLAGIITDTGHFRYATKETLDNAKFLLETGVSISEVTEKLSKKMARSEKIARIKGANRIQKIYYVHDYIIVFSHVSSYEASACKALIDLGADVSFIISYVPKTHEFRISSRARGNLIRETSLHLGEIMKIIGEKFNGSGGGHDGAAGSYGILNNENKDYMTELVPEILKLVKKEIENK